MSAIQKLLTDHIDLWTAAETEKKSGRGRSSGNAGSVYGIKKLRELILELAVRGKLVPQDANDEPASELLKRIQAEKAKLVAEGKIKKDKALPQITDEEKPFDLPLGWEWTRVGQIGHDWGQKTPDTTFTYIEVSAIESSRGTISKPVLVEAENAASRARKIVRKGTVIYSTVRPYLLNIAVIEKDYSPEPIASTAFAVVHPFCSMPPRFFLYFFRSPLFVRYVESVQMGIAYPAINDSQFFSGLIPLPPLAEQNRIVAKVDELMALCDQMEIQHSNAAEAHEKLVSHLLGTLTQSPVRGEPVEPHPSTSSGRTEFEDNWQRIAKHFDTLFTTEASIDALKQTLLQLAVMGKLVPQDPNDEPASELLKRIQAEKAKLVAEGKIKKSPLTPLLQRGESKATAMAAMSSSAAFESDNALPTSPTSPPLVKGGPGGISENEMPFELPPGWVLVRLSEITSIRGGGTPSMAKSEYWGGKIPWVSPKDMHNGIIVDSELKITDKALKESNLELVPVGSILIVGRSGILKRKLPAQITAVPCTVNQDIKAVTPIKPLSDRYMQLIFWGNEKEILVRDVKQGTTVQSLVYESLFSRPFTLPPLAEQHRIVAKVDELITLCDQLKSRITQAKQLQQKLADVLVEQAVSQ